ncbi:hypothetical protein BASA81_001772 [Batrachochytrium salamandrivorans]|nr:hypothetical protein BASA81_001772 [Batrachochytrium salamandrivorans]
MAKLVGRYVDLGLGEGALFKAFVAYPEPGEEGTFAVKYVQGTKEIIQFHDNHTATSLSLPNVRFTWKLHAPHSDYFSPKLSPQPTPSALPLQQKEDAEDAEDAEEANEGGEDRKKTPTKRTTRKRTTPPPTATSERPRRSITKRSRPTPRDDEDEGEDEGGEADPK